MDQYGEAKVNLHQTAGIWDPPATPLAFNTASFTVAQGGEPLFNQSHEPLPRAMDAFYHLRLKRTTLNLIMVDMILRHLSQNVLMTRNTSYVAAVEEAHGGNRKRSEYTVTRSYLFSNAALPVTQH